MVEFGFAEVAHVLRKKMKCFLFECAIERFHLCVVMGWKYFMHLRERFVVHLGKHFWSLLIPGRPLYMISITWQFEVEMAHSSMKCLIDFTMKNEQRNTFWKVVILD